MSDLVLSGAEVERLRLLASVLIPGHGKLPPAGSLEGFAQLLGVAVKACGYADRDIRAALDAIPEQPGWESVRAWSSADPAGFNIAATLSSGVYFMSPVVLGILGYPTERRHPAGVEDAANEYETGVLEPVIARGRRWREA
jgi:hypothetical protein